MRAVSTFFAIGAVLWSVASSAHALGFGRISNATQLGQPLNFAAAVRLDGDETLPRECVSADVISGDNKLVPGQVLATLEGSAADTERSVRVTTTTVIDEPVVTVTITLGCTSKVSRKFVLFVDPPMVNLAQAEPVLAPQRVDTQVAPIVRMVQGESRSSANANRPQRPAAARARPRTTVAHSTASETGHRTIQAPGAAKARRAAAHRPAAAGATPGGPRLELESRPTIVALSAASASAAASAANAAPVVAGAAASATGPDASADQLARERVRVQALEEGFAKLSRESAATQQSLAGLQARLREAESQRYANPLVYGLAWLSALLALAVAGLWWRQSRLRGAAQWWAGPVPASAAVPAAEPVISGPAPLGATPTAADAFEMSKPIEDDDTATGAVRATTTGLAAVAPISRFGRDDAGAPAPTAKPAPQRELSVDELIDLEQQAEFFIVLGQDDAAIELLMSHVRSDGGISPLPYLKLLEIYRRRGNHEAYQRIRERFNRRFNAYAPDWESDLQQGRVLADYPEIIARLQELWSAPVRVMETLDGSL
ncbi:MAG: hypothetical protein KGI87_11950, partial [Burkholderiales bacterium]|nr:hypothetical protein [Burkholderiales bacterium]